MDGDDLDALISCAGGASAACAAACPLTPDTQGVVAADFDHDVDGVDFAVLQRSFGSLAASGGPLQAE